MTELAELERRIDHLERLLLQSGIKLDFFAPQHHARHDAGGFDALTTVPDHDHSGDTGDGAQLDVDAAFSDFVHDHSTDAEGGQLDWDDIWGDGIHHHSSDAEGGQLDWDSCWADAVHDHSSDAEGGQLDWDDVWSDAVHDHTSDAEGGVLSFTNYCTIWSYPIWYSNGVNEHIFVYGEYNTLGDWATCLLDAAVDECWFTFCVPDHYTATDEIHVIGVSTSNTTIQYDLASDYGANGQNYNAHSESASNVTAAVTASKIKELDVSGVFSTLAAGDYCTLNFGYDSTSNFHVLGLKFTFH